MENITDVAGSWKRAVCLNSVLRTPAPGKYRAQGTRRPVSRHPNETRGSRNSTAPSRRPADGSRRVLFTN